MAARTTVTATLPASTACTACTANNGKVRNARSEQPASKITAETGKIGPLPQHPGRCPGRCDGVSRADGLQDRPGAIRTSDQSGEHERDHQTSIVAIVQPAPYLVR